MYIHACPHLIKCFITVIAPWLCCSCWVLSARLNLQPCSIYFLSTLPEFFSSFYTCVPVLWSLSVCIYKILTKFLTSTSFEWFPVSSLKLSITSKPTVWSNPTLRPYMTKSNLPAVLVASWTIHLWVCPLYNFSTSDSMLLFPLFPFPPPYLYIQDAHSQCTSKIRIPLI